MAGNRLHFYGSSHASSELGVVGKRPHGVVDTLGWMARAIAAMYRTDLQRRALADLGEHLLADIGIDRSTAQVKAARAPWDPLLPR